jgi:hypothetical protein
MFGIILVITADRVELALVIYYIQPYHVSEPDINLLKLDVGIRDALINGGFSTIKSMLECTTSDISSRVEVDLYVAKIIFEKAKKVTQELTKASAALDNNSFTSLNVAVENKKIQ